MAGELYHLGETFGDHIKRGSVRTRQRGKTTDCSHYTNCDKEINCRDGEDCPFFVFNPDRATLRPDEIEPVSLEEEFERILED